MNEFKRWIEFAIEDFFNKAYDYNWKTFVFDWEIVQMYIDRWLELEGEVPAGSNIGVPEWKYRMAIGAANAFREDRDRIKREFLFSDSKPLWSSTGDGK